MKDEQSSRSRNRVKRLGGNCGMCIPPWSLVPSHVIPFHSMVHVMKENACWMLVQEMSVKRSLCQDLAAQASLLLMASFHLINALLCKTSIALVLCLHQTKQYIISFPMLILICNSSLDHKMIVGTTSDVLRHSRVSTFLACDSNKTSRVSGSRDPCPTASTSNHTIDWL